MTGVKSEHSTTAATTMVDPQVVLRQKDRALKELESRVKLAMTQHQKMYEVQREHIVSEHDRTSAATKMSIEYETAAAQQSLEASYQQQLRSLASQAQMQRLQLEQQAHVLELHAVQQQMVRQHSEREAQWNTGYLLNN